MAASEKNSQSTRWTQRFTELREPQAGVFFWLSMFYVVYCSRPEDWIPGLLYVPLAKISGILALLGLVMAVGRTKRGFRDLPKEATYLLGIILFLFLAGALSTIWRGGAISKTLDFCKALVAWVLTFFVVTNFQRLRRIIFIQSASVAVIAVVSVIKGHSRPRLEGVIGGIYSNPNDLAFAIVLSLPFCFAFMLQSRNVLAKMVWGVSMLAMCTALFMTASRAGFIDLMVTGLICLWFFGVKGKRYHLIAATALVAILVGFTAGGRLKDRFVAISGQNLEDREDVSAYGSYEQRRYLIVKSMEAIVHYPWGLGQGNFSVYSGMWRDVHTSYLQIASEGGLGAFLLYLLFFGRGFGNLRRLRKLPGYDPQMELFASALFATLVGFLVGSLFAPEAYQYFPYFAVAYTSVMYAICKENQPAADQVSGVNQSRWSRVPLPVPAGPAPLPSASGKQPRSPSAVLRDLR